MNSSLLETDNICRKVQDYLDPEPDVFEKMTEEEWLNHREMYDSSNAAHRAAIAKLMELLPKLSTQEISEGYTEGCRLFQRALSGYMVRNFNLEYIPTMMDAINTPHLHTARNFLQSLADNIGSEISSTVLAALDVNGLCETALSIVGQLSLTEALPKVQQLISDPDPAIASIAQTILSELNNS